MIYLASPYSHFDPKVREARFELACEACAWLTRKGFLVYSPICHWHPIAVRHQLPTDFGFWSDTDQVMIGVCSHYMILRIDGWKTSLGIKAELQIAINLELDIAHLTKKKDGWNLCLNQNATDS